MPEIALQPPGLQRQALHSRPLELCTTLLVSLGFAVESSDLNRQSLTPLVKAGSVNVSKIDSSSYHVVIRQPND